MSPGGAQSTVRRRAAWIGGALGMVVQYWMVTSGTGDLFRAQRDADYFDAQAHAWLAGHWWVPARVVGLEGIVVNGHTQMYFGPLPALFRVPFALFTDSLDSRLAALSMLVAAGVAVFASVRLLGQAHRLRRPDTPWSTADVIATAAVAFGVPAATTVLFLSSRTLVYHEASMWGIALSLLALSLVIDAAERATARNLVLASAMTTAAISSRVSVGLGPAAALGVLALVLSCRSRRPAWGAAVATGVPILAYAVVNFVRFHTLFSVPLRDQVRAMIDPASKEFLRHNSGFFGLQFVPTSLVAYFRPTGLRFSGWYPFVDFPRSTPVVGNVVFNNIERVASAPVTMPALMVLAVGGIAILVRRNAPTPFRIAVIGAGVGCVTMFLFCYIAHRYLGDLVPFLVIAGVVAVDALVGAGHTRWRPWAVGGLAVLGVFGVWVNAGLGVLQQGAWGSQLDQSDIARFVNTRLSINDQLGWETPMVHSVASGARLPTRANAADYAIVGDCDALYIFSGTRPNFLEPTTWRPVERTRASGTRRFAVRYHDAPKGTIEPLIAIGTQDPPAVLGLEHLGGGRARLVWQGPPDPYHGTVFMLQPGTHTLDVTADPYLNQLRVDIDGDKVLEGFFGTSGLDMSLGQLPVPVAGIEPTLDGSIREVASHPDTSLCRSLQ